jgi:predicted DNA-binding transcriptional regulator YafY
LVFTQREALALVMAVLDGHHAASDIDDPVGSALGKLMRSLPASVARQADLIRGHAVAVPDRDAAGPDPSTTAVLVSAIAENRLAKIAYLTANGSCFETDVDPWAVVVRHGRWYLLCWSHAAEARRAYRIDRVNSVDVTERAAMPAPPGDPISWLEEHLADGWAFETHVVFEAHFADVARWVSAPMGRLEPVEDRCVLRGTTNNPAMYAGEWLAGIPFPFQVVGGIELREAVATVAHRLNTSLDDAPSTS